MHDHGQRHRPDPQKSLVEFIVGDVHYAIDIAHVREIVNPLVVTPLPHTPMEVVGVADHRGEVVPIVDLRVRFGLPPSDPTRTTKWILLTKPERSECTGVPERTRGLIGLIVDAVTEVFGVTNEEFRRTPENSRNNDVRGIAGVVTHNGMLTFVLDNARIFEMVDSLSVPEFV